MLVVVEWSTEALRHPPSVATLVATLAEHEVVLVSSHRAADGGALPELRAALRGRHMVALVVDRDVPAHERALIEELLNEGKVPVLLTLGDPASAELDWLDAETRLTLPAEATPAEPDDREAALVEVESLDEQVRRRTVELAQMELRLVQLRSRIRQT